MISYNKDNFEISTDPARIDVVLVHAFLSNSYWARGISFDKVQVSIKNSLCFGVYGKGGQVGFARVVSDMARIAYMADVFIIEQFRGLGLSKWLIQTIMQHPPLREISKWFLVTADAHGLYEQFGFRVPESPGMYMELLNNR